MKNLEVCVQITIKPTEASVDHDKNATQVDGGQFRLVLKEGSLFDIEALEGGYWRQPNAATGTRLPSSTAVAISRSKGRL